LTRALALTSGDPGGVGLDLAIAAWQAREVRFVPCFYILADPSVIAARAGLLGADIEIVDSSPRNARSHFAGALPVAPLENGQTGDPGRSDPANAGSTVEAIDRAVADVMNGDAAAVVTLPIAKKPLHEAGFKFPGHTEYLAHLARQRTGTAAMPVMMLAGPGLRTVPVTVHMPLADVPKSLTGKLIVETCRIAAVDLEKRFGIANPRLVVAGLNPHAGENGSFGAEDDTVIRPAVEALAARGFSVKGPLPADTMFHERAREKYDAAICMYHDQALIPAKTLDFERTVNVTLGLPFVRTSPDHGAAFDIAGTGAAGPQSLIEALRLAARLSGAGAGGEP